MISVSYRMEECDILVIGGGGAGVIASIEASENKDLKTILVSKGPISRSGLTPTANGGTNAASAEEMFKKAITGGNYLNDQKIIWHMADKIRDSLEKLKQLGVSVTPFGKSSVCVPGTSTLEQLREILITRPNVRLLEDVLITNLIMQDRKPAGATALDISTGEFFIIQSSTVIMATGGLVGELYPHSSNNPFGITTNASGTGHVMVYLAGAELIDMEMIQFVPLPANPKSLHIRYFPEFWVGPYLNRKNEIIEQNADVYLDGSYHYSFVQKLFREIHAGNGPIYIDHRGYEKTSYFFSVKQWDARRKMMRLLGIDPLDNKIEIILGSHFGMGGIRVNEKTETSVPGLLATGEVMGGVHGAMRISGFSFAQLIVFGFEVGKQALEYAENQHKNALRISDEAVEIEKKKVFGFLQPKANSVSVGELKKLLQQVMQDHVFIIRNADGLREAIKQIHRIKEEVPNISVPDFKRFNLDWVRAIEFSLMVESAKIIAQSALIRDESRGSHYREDFPKENNEKWLKHTLAKLENGRLNISSIPVDLSRIKPDGYHD